MITRTENDVCATIRRHWAEIDREYARKNRTGTFPSDLFIEEYAEKLGIKLPKVVTTGNPEIDADLDKIRDEKLRELSEQIDLGIKLAGFNAVMEVFDWTDSQTKILGKCINNKYFLKFWENTTTENTDALYAYLSRKDGGLELMNPAAKLLGISVDFTTEYKNYTTEEALEIIKDSLKSFVGCIAAAYIAADTVARYGEKLLHLNDEEKKEEEKSEQSEDPILRLVNHAIGQVVGAADAEKLSDLFPNTQVRGPAEGVTPKPSPSGAKDAERKAKEEARAAKSRGDNKKTGDKPAEEATNTKAEENTETLDAKISRLHNELDAINMLLDGDPKNKVNLKAKEDKLAEIAEAEKAKEEEAKAK